uniref:CUB domain-containing protein n=1 Tax=Clytia hemisphaerica TaxID=252671 RepID=A0A7M5TYL5_9CNID|eukprot:TCONS_00028858-protein
MNLNLIFVLIAFKFEFTFSWPYECDRNRDCCSYVVDHENGTMQTKQKPECHQFHIDLSIQHRKTFTASNNGNLEYYMLENVGGVSVLKWVEFRLSSTTQGCAGEIYVQVGCTNQKVFGPFCGNSAPHEFYSRDGCMTVIVQNGKRYNTTVKFTFETVDFSMMASRNSPSTCNNQKVFKQSTGVIMSPNWPFPLDNDIDCLWKIETASNRDILINIIDFELDSNDDSLVAIYGFKPKDTKYNKFNKKLERQEDFNQHKSFSTKRYGIHVTFHGRRSARGFALGWTTTKKAEEEVGYLHFIGIGVAIIFFICCNCGQRKRRQQQAIQDSQTANEEGDSQTEEGGSEAGEEESPAQEGGDSHSAPTAPAFDEGLPATINNTNMNPEHNFPPQFVGYHPNQEGNGAINFGFDNSLPSAVPPPPSYTTALEYPDQPPTYEETIADSANK